MKSQTLPIKTLTLSMLLAVLLACHNLVFASSNVLTDLQVLSDATMQGRKTGSEGAEKARSYISQRFQHLGLQNFLPNYLHPFDYKKAKTGVNVIGFKAGCVYPQHFVVVTAHYDHLGKQRYSIFYGADDNASGIAAMLFLAERLAAECPAFSYIFVATDAEEDGLYGSKAFVAEPPVPLTQIILNVNLDMLGQPDNSGRMYLTGAKRYPQLTMLLDAQFPKLKFLSHRGPGLTLHGKARSDWLNASDHGPFHRAGISYLFFGGHEHADYHTPNDTFERINTEFFITMLDAIWQTVNWIEQQPPSSL